MRNLILIEENNIERLVMMEVWKPVEGWNNYEVSNFGQVRNCRTGRVLKPCDNGNGYLQVNLYENGLRKCYQIHRLVAIAFIPNPAGLPQVNHISEVPTDNRACNLEWCDAKYNNNYGSHNEKVALALSKPVEQYDLEGNYIRTWIGAKEAERQTGICNSHISQCCNGKRKTAGGFIWRFAKNLD